jgi:hypothetical protein
LLFINANTIKSPRWVVDTAALAKKMGLQTGEEEQKSWKAEYAPTQVKNVGLLQLLQGPPLVAQSQRRVAIMLSVWDKVANEGVSPGDFLRMRMPMLDQYLRRNSAKLPFRIYSVSAQGGDYDDGKLTEAQKAKLQVLRQIGEPSERIQLVDGSATSHDLTEPIAWLMAR